MCLNFHPLKLTQRHLPPSSPQDTKLHASNDSEGSSTPTIVNKHSYILSFVQRVTSLTLLNYIA
jgi:hypothetical protein